uniref:Uncharacterized protein n=1 Tax=Cucumis melo TaxID=3656 RepID=A0A9I9E1U8_CUCME
RHPHVFVDRPFLHSDTESASNRLQPTSLPLLSSPPPSTVPLSSFRVPDVAQNTEGSYSLLSSTSLTRTLSGGAKIQTRATNPDQDEPRVEPSREPRAEPSRAEDRAASWPTQA